MRLIFDPKPVKTFSFQISFNIGWRHEPPKEKGVLRKELVGLLNLILNTLPPWFDGFYHLDAEFSSIVVLGLSDNQEKLPKILQIIVNNFPKKFSELKSEIELVTLSGGVKKSLVDNLKEFQIERKGGRPKIHFVPKRFLNLKELTRVHKHFLTSIMLKKGKEFFLEVSPRGDRIQYGMKIDNVAIENLDDSLKSYEHWLRRRFESTKETTSLLTLMNIYERYDRSIEDIIKEIYTINAISLKESLEKLENIKTRMNNA